MTTSEYENSKKDLRNEINALIILRNEINVMLEDKLRLEYDYIEPNRTQRV